MDTRLRSVTLTASTLCVAAIAQAVDFGGKAAFEQNRPLQFPDFALTYIGERRVVTEKFARGIVIYDFRVVGQKETQNVSWSAGTGDIGPVLFRVAGKQFALELKRSDKLGPLKPNELVVSRAP